MFSVSYAVYLFIIATILAFIEIQIEGRHGWMERIPCWRPDPKSLLARFYAKMLGGKPMTGYHLAMFGGFLPLFLHFPFIAGVPWNLVKKLETISAYFLLITCEDFLWFVWNPFYGLKKFNAKSIWWHKKWVGPAPMAYPVAIAISLVLALTAATLAGISILVWWGITLGILGGLTLVSCFISEIIKKGQTEI